MIQAKKYSDVKSFAEAGFPGSYSYPEYRSLIQALLTKGKTTGTDHSTAMLEYTRMNEHRSNRWDKHFVPRADVVEALESVSGKFSILVITEGWCGDSSQVLPVIALMAHSAGISLRIILRDENHGLMDQYLTNGSKSIPVVIGLDADGNDVFRWGPRPQPIQVEFLAMKNSVDPAYTHDQISEVIHLRYAREKGEAIQNEFLEIAKSL